MEEAGSGWVEVRPALASELPWLAAMLWLGWLNGLLAVGLALVDGIVGLVGGARSDPAAS
jgi:hypothetical protein